LSSTARHRRAGRGSVVARRDHFFAVVAVDVEVLPDHRPTERLDVQHDLAVQEDAHAARRLTHRHGNRLRLLADGGGGPVTCAQTLAQRDPLRRAIDEHARGLGDAVAADDDRPLELGDVLDLLAHLLVANVALFR
jgi:hypothetical protein